MTIPASPLLGARDAIGVALFVLALVLLPAPGRLAAQVGADERDTLVFSVDPLVVTATGGAREASRVPQPVWVVQRRDLAQHIPNTVTDLFRTLPGVDVTGVGVNQGRPQIRGQRGQRILLLEDGLRMNNFRRQQDFGELPALIDVTGVERIEIVRGPASVLYGSDAIGGVVNIITRIPTQEGLHGTASVRYGAVESQMTESARIYGRFGDLTLRAGGTLREADPYEAPEGSFGAITLDSVATVAETGIKDVAADLRLGWEPVDGRHQVFGKFELYEADTTGFGSVDPALYSPGSPTIAITYPAQLWTKLTAGYTARDLGTPVADRVELTAYGQDNERDLVFDFALRQGPGLISLFNQNFTDVRTYGGRAEARKLVAAPLLLTYGVDLVRERVEGTDNNRTSVTGFGPPFDTTTTRPQLPEASFNTLGLFLQGEVEATDRLSFVAGGRYQRVAAETFATPGLEDQQPTEIADHTVVGALNSVFEVGGGFTLVGAVGRAFRSPNLIERFFDGPTPEGNGYQVRNPGLESETSFNVDLGVRYNRGALSAQAFAFRNKISDGIRTEPLETEVDGLAAFRNTNVEELVFRGFELAGDADVSHGFSVGTSFSRLESEDALNEDNPVGETFSSKVTGTLRYEHPSDRVWAAWEVRHNGERKDVPLGEGHLLGDVLPAFTVMDLRTGVTVLRTDGGMVHRLSATVSNVTDALYAEFSNASFFRPEPKRNLSLMWEVSF